MEKREYNFIEDLIIEIHNLDFNILLIKAELEQVKNTVKAFEKPHPFEENLLFTIPAFQHIPQTQNLSFSTHYNTSIKNITLEDLKRQDISFSTGNRGVPTDRQTNQQTDRHIDFSSKSGENPSPLENASKILDSPDNMKNEIRIRFKRLTEQELLVFSTIYQLDEEKGYSDYKILSEKLGLSESSIRDYIGRLIKKGIPVEKQKINNKTVNLTISHELKKLASLSTILKLREI
jgi:predicted transcriptional regulator